MIALDIDNVLSDFEVVYRGLINELTGRNAVREEITSYSFTEALGLSEEENDLVWNSFNEKDGWRRLPLIPGALEAAAELGRLDEVVILSNRPYSAVSSTEAWLKEHGIPHDDLIVFPDGSKRDYLEARGLRPALVIEDAAHHASEFASSGIRVILIDYPWNQGVSHELIHRVRTVGEAAAAARDHFKKGR